MRFACVPSEQTWFLHRLKLRLTNPETGELDHPTAAHWMLKHRIDKHYNLQSLGEAWNNAMEPERGVQVLEHVVAEAHSDELMTHPSDILPELGERHIRGCLIHLGIGLELSGRFDEAIDVLRDVLQRWREEDVAFGITARVETLEVMDNLSVALYGAYRYQEAEALQRESLDLGRETRLGDPYLSMCTLSDILYSQAYAGIGGQAAATAKAEEAVELTREYLAMALDDDEDEETVLLAQCMVIHALLLLHGTALPDCGRKLARQVLRTTRERHAEDAQRGTHQFRRLHVDALVTAANVSHTLQRNGEAEALLREAVAMLRDWPTTVAKPYVLQHEALGTLSEVLIDGARKGGGAAGAAQLDEAMRLSHEALGAIDRDEARGWLKRAHAAEERINEGLRMVEVLLLRGRPAEARAALQDAERRLAGKTPAELFGAETHPSHQVTMLLRALVAFVADAGGVWVDDADDAAAAMPDDGGATGGARTTTASHPSQREVSEVVERLRGLYPGGERSEYAVWATCMLRWAREGARPLV